jgi:hypothetical protein
VGDRSADPVVQEMPGPTRIRSRAVRRQIISMVLEKPFRPLLSALRNRQWPCRKNSYWGVKQLTHLFGRLANSIRCAGFCGLLRSEYPFPSDLWLGTGCKAAVRTCTRLAPGTRGPKPGTRSKPGTCVRLVPGTCVRAAPGTRARRSRWAATGGEDTKVQRLSGSMERTGNLSREHRFVASEWPE